MKLHILASVALLSAAGEVSAKVRLILSLIDLWALSRCMMSVYCDTVHHLFGYYWLL